MTTPAAQAPNQIAPEGLARIRSECQELISEVSRVYVGPSQTVELLLTALLARGHVLLEGVPGVAKTTLVRAFSQTLGCVFKRIQFTPDLLPADITGTYVLDMRTNTFSLRQGPVFANIVLGDEINRAPAKSQSALLEAMQESQVTIEGDTRPLPQPFMVLATQNPIEHEGTYPLPEAQIDRFLLKLATGHPSAEDECRMLRIHSHPVPAIQTRLAPARILELQSLADEVHVAEELLEFIVALTRYTRRHRSVYLGASPRASLMLLRASKAHALVNGRSHVLPDDAKLLAPAVLSHRVILGPEAEMAGLRPDTIVLEALDRVAHHR